MLDRIPTPGQEGRVLVTPEDGAPFYAKIQMADNPTQEGHSFSKETMLKDSTASLYGLGVDGVPDEVFGKIKPSVWELIASFKEAGTFEYVVPENCYKIGIYMAGAGGDGGVLITTDEGVSIGGASGYGKNFILPVTPGDVILGVVGDRPGGTTSIVINEVGYTVDGGSTGASRSGYNNSFLGGASGGQCSSPSNARNAPPYSANVLLGCFYAGVNDGQSPAISQNKFDKTMVTLAAGGSCTYYQGYEYAPQTVLELPDGTRAGNGVKNATLDSLPLADATGNGNGGGGVHFRESVDGARGGYGSPGMVLIYR